MALYFRVAVFLLLGSVHVLSSSVSASYVGAVVEHTVYFGDKSDSSDYLLEVNIEQYEQLIHLSKSQSAQVVVFPEFGLTPVEAEQRSDLYPYIEVIPEVNQSHPINPCEAPSEFEDAPILLRMSCAARSNGILVLVNMIDKQECSPAVDSDCPGDGHYQYNTDVVFDESGNMIAKYHKSHEWVSLKVAYDQPKTPSEISFLSSFGVEFGLFICFDIMFEDPPKVLRSRGVKHFLYAVMQGDIGERLLIEPWSKNNQATVLSANLGSGEKKDCSAIIVNGTVLDSKKYYLESDLFPHDNIVVATIPV
mmetsp:Transcript_20929/g.30162  ORF Transcript_20929/g.30162 Transcript_20929/m.30162 type:complete len:307 (+) Transcript_20929:30-950(+)